jgi:hypothetical protein
MIPERFGHILFGLILTGVMSCIVSGIATFQALEDGVPFMGAWTGSWMISWGVSFPTVLVVAPLTRRTVARLVH